MSSSKTPKILLRLCILCILACCIWSFSGRASHTTTQVQGQISVTLNRLQSENEVQPVDIRCEPARLLTPGQLAGFSCTLKNNTMVRIYTAQSALPHLAGKVQSIDCPRCSASLFDTGESAYTPHEQHECAHCHFVFKTRKVIANPLVAVLESLKRNAVREPQKHDLGLLPETL